VRKNYGRKKKIHQYHVRLPDIRIIGLSMHDRDDRAAGMIEAGASAYCTKGGATDELLSAIRGETKQAPHHET